MKSKKTVSLCLLTYNRGEKIKRTIDTVLNQTYSEFELIINDDSSTDQTGEICREYERRDSRVRYERNDENLMLAGNANRALRRANFSLVGILHDSDLYEPFMLERWVEKMDKFPSAAIVFHGHYRKIGGEPHIHPFPEFIEGDTLLRNMLSRWDSPIYGICMMRKDAVKKVGGYNEEYPFISDVDLYMRLASEYDVAYVQEPLVRYAPREDNHEYKGAHWGEEKSIYKIRKNNIKKNFKEGSKERSVLMKKFKKDRNKRFTLKMAWCIRNMELEKICRGLELAKKIDSRYIKTFSRAVEKLMMFI